LIQAVDRTEGKSFFVVLTFVKEKMPTPVPPIKAIIEPSGSQPIGRLAS